jgi:hypothetical protein
MDSEILGLFEAIVGFIFFIAVCVTISRVGEIRDQAKRQTELLERIVKNTNPAPDPATKPTASVANTNERQKSGLGTATAIIVVVALLIIVLGLATK